MNDQLMTDILTEAGLTQDELYALHSKLCGWGTRFANISHSLAGVALARYRTSTGLPGDRTDVAMWTEREGYMECMYDIYGVASCVGSMIYPPAALIPA